MAKIVFLDFTLFLILVAALTISITSFIGALKEKKDKKGQDDRENNG